MLFKLIILSILNFYQPPHDIAMATFAVTLEEHTIQLKVQLDKGDMDATLNIAAKNDGSSEKLATYVSKHVIWIINNQPTTFEFTSFKENEDFYFLETAPVNFATPFTTLDLHNTCLVETVDKHSNVIYIKQKGKEMRGFRMNKKRTQISIEL